MLHITNRLKTTYILLSSGRFWWTTHHMDGRSLYQIEYFETETGPFLEECFHEVMVMVDMARRKEDAQSTGPADTNPRPLLPYHISEIGTPWESATRIRRKEQRLKNTLQGLNAPYIRANT
ncbi:hypothetical protein PV10_08514 [Exophiala mesophila]|uniref:Uncharacterized protein n=1 Tax=Exophiala mesophila TaxID=212818 RepID=A0A0D1XL05_EXOME|nr:uncharacterized protein PV10_08514 [Exophiala mesophila]KIV88881.1 hypothetical protein PV10_08514 [Exophiala mesophila]